MPNRSARASRGTRGITFYMRVAAGLRDDAQAGPFFVEKGQDP